MEKQDGEFGEKDPDEGVPLPQVDGYHIEAVDPAYVETSFNGGDREYKKPPPTPDKADLPRVNLVRKPMAYAAAPLAEEEEEFPSPSEAAYFQRLRSSKDEYQPKASQKDGHMEYEMQQQSTSSKVSQDIKPEVKTENGGKKRQKHVTRKKGFAQYATGSAKKGRIERVVK